MKKSEARQKAKLLVMEHINKIRYSREYEEFVAEIGDKERTDALLREQVNRIARMFDFSERW